MFLLDISHISNNISKIYEVKSFKISLNNLNEISNVLNVMFDTNLDKILTMNNEKKIPFFKVNVLNLSYNQVKNTNITGSINLLLKEHFEKIDLITMKIVFELNHDSFKAISVFEKRVRSILRNWRLFKNLYLIDDMVELNKLNHCGSLNYISESMSKLFSQHTIKEHDVLNNTSINLLDHIYILSCIYSHSKTITHRDKGYYKMTFLFKYTDDLNYWRIFNTQFRNLPDVDKTSYLRVLSIEAKDSSLRCVTILKTYKYSMKEFSTCSMKLNQRLMERRCLILLLSVVRCINLLLCLLCLDKKKKIKIVEIGIKNKNFLLLLLKTKIKKDNLIVNELRQKDDDEEQVLNKANYNNKLYYNKASNTGHILSGSKEQFILERYIISGLNSIKKNTTTETDIIRDKDFPLIDEYFKEIDNVLSFYSQNPFLINKKLRMNLDLIKSLDELDLDLIKSLSIISKIMTTFKKNNICGKLGANEGSMAIDMRRNNNNKINYNNNTLSSDRVKSIVERYLSTMDWYTRGECKTKQINILKINNYHINFTNDNSPYSSSSFFLKKKNNDLRLSIGFTNGFNQIKIRRAFRKYTAIKPGPKLFRQYVSKILGDVPNCFVYIDDIVIYTKTKEKQCGNNFTPINFYLCSGLGDVAIYAFLLDNMIIKTDSKIVCLQTLIFQQGYRDRSISGQQNNGTENLSRSSRNVVTQKRRLEKKEVGRILVKQEKKNEIFSIFMKGSKTLKYACTFMDHLNYTKIFFSSSRCLFKTHTSILNMSFSVKRCEKHFKNGVRLYENLTTLLTITENNSKINNNYHNRLKASSYEIKLKEEPWDKFEGPYDVEEVGKKGKWPKMNRQNNYSERDKCIKRHDNFNFYFTLNNINLNSLKYVILNFNKLLKNIENYSIKINLKYINISGNKLTDFPYRYLCNNYIVNIEPICEINNLEYLHLRNNKITEITNNIGNLKNLINCVCSIMFLYIENNQISGISDNIGNLEELVLSSNNISFLTKSLINCKNLLKLDLQIMNDRLEIDSKS
ncbi:small gtp-binding protein [Vairimorpha apis BRL 01]|uniref:Small gtp-binding protein n=1 Tax=Vairimorpha apis BRL 01 TaxID=1037528 RepID=T0KZD5_9MICR|nr:small gtp-binding protein [Vairimorpha apis BRL 01]